MCENHFGAKVMFWCKSCQTKICRKSFGSDHESHALINFRKHLKETVEPVYAKFNTRANLLLSTAMELNNQLWESNVNNNRRGLIAVVTKHITDIQSQTKKWESVGKFIQNPDDEVNLNIIESFLSQPCSDWEQIDLDLNCVRASQCGNFKLSTDFNFSSDSNPPSTTWILTTFG